MVPVIVALPIGNVIRKLTCFQVPIQNLIDLRFCMYPPSPTVELPTFFIFASRCGTSNFRFGGFFFYFRRLFLPIGGIIFRFWLFGTSNFRFGLNCRKLCRCRMAHNDRRMMHNGDIRLFRCFMLHRFFRRYGSGRWPLERLCSLPFRYFG